MKKVQFINETIPNEFTKGRIYDTYTVYDEKHLALKDDAGDEHLIASIHNDKQAFEGDPSFNQNFKAYEDITELLDTTKMLRIAHIPQLGGHAFHVNVDHLQEAKKIMDVLAAYDHFQYENRIKPDYANATFLEEFDLNDGEWVSWMDDETGIDDLDEFLEFLADVQNDENKPF